MSDTKPKPSAISLLFGVPEVARVGRSSNGLTVLTKHRQSRAEGMQPAKPRICAAEGCSNVLAKRDDENLVKFSGRIYCSKACRSATVAKRVSQRWAMAAAERPKTCESCGALFVKKARESWRWFGRRQKCRPECDGTAAPADMADGE